MIIADLRESNNNDGQTILRLLHHPDLLMLDHGDYLIRGHKLIVLIERVTAAGLIQDISSGRIVDKLSGCAEDADIVILLVEGLILEGEDGYALIQYKPIKQDSFKLPSGPFPTGVKITSEFRQTRWQYNAIRGFLISASLRWCHNIEFTTSPHESAECIMQMDKYFCKPAEEHTLHLRRSRPFTMSRKKDKREQQEYILSAFPDISAGRSKTIIDHFGTIPIQWSVDEKILMSIPGIGKILAKKLLEVLE